MTFFGKATIAALGMAVVSSLAMAQSDWKDKFSFSGDYRFRFDRQTDGSTTGTAAGTATNDRMRFRARLLFTGKVNDSMTAVTRFSTGDGSVRSTLHTLGTNGTAGGANAMRLSYLQLAYLDYKVMDNLNIQFGKVPNMFWEAGGEYFIHVADMSWEGMQAAWTGDMGNMKPYAHVDYHYIADRVNNQPNSATGGPDITMFGGQAGMKMSMSPLDLNVAVGSLNYSNVKGYTSNGGNLCSSATSCYGNSVDTTTSTMKYEYKLLTAALEVGYNLGFAPISVYTTYVQNQDPSDNNKGMLGGVKLGALKDVGSWSVSTSYRDLAKDSTIGDFTDFSWLLGGTDIMGMRTVAAYQMWKDASWAFIWDSGRRSVSSTPTTYENFYLDLNAKF